MSETTGTLENVHMPRVQEYQVRRTFTGSSSNVWNEFIQ